MFDDIDIKENDLMKDHPEAFRILLRDHSRFMEFKKANSSNMNEEELSEHKDDPCNLIIWATDDYSSLGEDYQSHKPIMHNLVTEENGWIIKPRCKKSPEEQVQRVKDKAEVFTPSWICNRQNNLIDEAWFGRKDVFNKEIILEDGTHSWVSTKEKIEFPEGKTWKDYVKDVRLEITCGEAPYLCSRYDTTTGEEIKLENRIGLLDRKLRVISENCNTSGVWLKMAQTAYKSIYGYEWQGDNLLLARESLLHSFIKYYRAMSFTNKLQEKSVNYIAYIISWNIWQMDGLKMVIPYSCENHYETVEDLFGTHEIEKECPGCKEGGYFNHIGIPCYVRKWGRSQKGHEEIPFYSLLINK